ncbi:MAG: GHMP kinase [Dehalococcoidia bacterium]|nr:GHMP kinase [Dehalococcoidia bacterium]
MIITRAPVRIGLAGGGTDLPAFYEQAGGRVLNAAINRYVYVVLSANRRGGIQLTSSDFSAFLNFDPGADLDSAGDSLGLVRAVLAEFGVSEGVDVFTASETPPGTGLGSSSATAVALVKAVSTFLGQQLTDHEVAERACHIELERLHSPIGKQDQYAAAFGGFNVLEFTRAGAVSVHPLDIAPETVAALERRLHLYFTGVQREANRILRTQSDNAREPATAVSMAELIEFAALTEAALLRDDLDEVGRLLRVGWEKKRGLASGISTDEIDGWIAHALANGALGAKLTGAGGGGYLLAMAAEGEEERLRAAMLQAGLKPLDYRFDWSGARVLMNSERRAWVPV